MKIYRLSVPKQVVPKLTFPQVAKVKVPKLPNYSSHLANLQPTPASPDSNLSKAEQQLQTAKERLTASGQKVPPSKDEGRHGFMYYFNLVAGALSGAVETTISDVANGGNFNLGKDLSAMWNMNNRVTGGELLQQLGVQNKWARGIGGAILDTVLDPTTYIGVGAVKNLLSKGAMEASSRILAEETGRSVEKISQDEVKNVLQKAAEIGQREPGRTVIPDTPEGNAIARVANEVLQRDVGRIRKVNLPEFKAQYSKFLNDTYLPAKQAKSAADLSEIVIGRQLRQMKTVGKEVARFGAPVKAMKAEAEDLSKSLKLMFNEADLNKLTSAILKPVSSFKLGGQSIKVAFQDPLEHLLWTQRTSLAKTGKFTNDSFGKLAQQVFKAPEEVKNVAQRFEAAVKDAAKLTHAGKDNALVIPASGFGTDALDAAKQPLLDTLGRYTELSDKLKSVNSATKYQPPAEYFQQLNDLQQQYSEANAASQQAKEALQAARQAKRQLDAEGASKVYTVGNSIPTYETRVLLNMGIPLVPKMQVHLDVTPIAHALDHVMMALPGMKTVAPIVKQAFTRIPAPAQIKGIIEGAEGAQQAATVQGVSYIHYFDKLLGGTDKEIPELHQALGDLLEGPYSAAEAHQKIDQVAAELRRPGLNVNVDNLHEAYDRARALMDALHDKEVKAGVSSQEAYLEHYLPHLISGAPKDKSAFSKWAKNLETPTNKHWHGKKQSFQYQRSLQDRQQLLDFIDQWNKENPDRQLRLVRDIGTMMGLRTFASAEAIFQKQFYQNIRSLATLHPDLVRRSYGANVKALNEAADLVPFPADIKELEGYKGSKEVVQAISQYKQLFTNDQALNTMLRLFDKGMQLFKASVTFSSGNLIRNMLGNVLNGFVGGLRSPEDYAMGMGLLMRGATSGLPEEMTQGLHDFQVTDKVFGKVWDGNTIAQDMLRLKVLNRGSQLSNFTSALTPEDLWKEMQKTDFSKIYKHPQRLIWTNLKANNVMDDWFRASMYISQLRRTGDPVRAANQVKKYLFDYSDLAPFERNVLGRIVPFYTWMRKNIALQLQTLLLNPGVTFAFLKAQQEMADALGVDFNKLPSYVADSFMIPVSVTPTGMVHMLSGNALPVNDLTLIFQNPLPGGTGGGALANINPVLSLALEYATNFDFNTGAPLDPIAAQFGTAVSAQSIINKVFQQTGIPYQAYRAISGNSNQLLGPSKPQEQRTQFTPAPNTSEGALGLTTVINTPYFQQKVEPYAYAQQLDALIKKLTNEGKVVYTKQEIDHAKRLKVDPATVHAIDTHLDSIGERKTLENEWKVMQGGIQ